MKDTTEHEWLSAREAIHLIVEHNSINGAGAAICKRAEVGLIVTRAVLFRKPVAQTYGSAKLQDFANVQLPKRFWEFVSLSRADWAAGDFSAWVDSSAHWQAFGVEFERLGVKAMLPGIKEQALGEAEGLQARTGLLPTPRQLPADSEIQAKMLELHEMGVRRDVAAKLIRQIAGFESVGNDHARRVAAGILPQGRPTKTA